MKKFLSVLIIFAIVMGLIACGNGGEEQAGSTSKPVSSKSDKPNAPEDPKPENSKTSSGEHKDPPDDPVPDIKEGTAWNSVGDFDKIGKKDSVWRYYFLDSADSSRNPMGGYEEREGGSLCEWYPWEGDCWVGIGFNSDVKGYMEMNNDGESMQAALGFVAPADGKYVITSEIWNPWEQNMGDFKISKIPASDVNDSKVHGSVVLEEFIDVYGYITPTEVTLDAGDMLLASCESLGEWVSVYFNMTVHYEPTDPSVYEIPEFEIPEPPESSGGVGEDEDEDEGNGGNTGADVPNVSGAVYSSAKDFSKTDADGIWVYANTFDGESFNVLERFDDSKGNLAQWYSDNHTGIGINYDVGADWIEANVNGEENEAMALGFKAPESRDYEITVFAKEMWGNNGEIVRINSNGQIINTVALDSSASSLTFKISLEQDEVLYFYGTSNGGWVCAYLAVFVK